MEIFNVYAVQVRNAVVEHSDWIKWVLKLEDDNRTSQVRIEIRDIGLNTEGDQTESSELEFDPTLFNPEGYLARDNPKSSIYLYKFLNQLSWVGYTRPTRTRALFIATRLVDGTTTKSDHFQSNHTISTISNIVQKIFPAFVRHWGYR
jgi:hypothetical protein